MNQRHWTNDEILDHIYGVGPEDGHDRDCPECRERIDALQALRKARHVEPWVPEEFLQSQREAVRMRVSHGAGLAGAWWSAPAWAALMVALAVGLSWPTPPAERLVAGGKGAPPDAGMYLEIYQTISTEEPRALAPMHALFEE